MKGFLTAVSLSFATLFDFFVHSSGITGCFFMGYSPRNLGKRKGGGKTKIEDGIFERKSFAFCSTFSLVTAMRLSLESPRFSFFFQHSCCFNIHALSRYIVHGQFWSSTRLEEVFV